MSVRRTYRAPHRPKVNPWAGKPYRPAPVLVAPPVERKPLTHEPGERKYKPGTGDVAILMRILCRCGWAGCWFSTEYAAEKSVNRHVEHAMKKGDR